MRIRTIKPSFWNNEELAQISPIGRLLFIGLWSLADREGRLEDRPARIKHDILGYDKCEIDGLLNELQEKGFIARYEVNGYRYIAIPTFARHQRPNVHEPASTFPAPSGNDHARACTNMISEVGDASIPVPVPDLDLNPDPDPDQDPDLRASSLPKNGNGKNPDSERLVPEDLMEAWNEHCVPAGLKAVDRLSVDRRRKAAQRLHEQPDKEFWSRIFTYIPASSFLRGFHKPRAPDEKPFKADFDWLIHNSNNCVKVYEGKYNGEN